MFYLCVFAASEAIPVKYNIQLHRKNWFILTALISTV